MFRLGARRGSFFCAALNKRPSLCGVSWWSAGFAQGGAKCKFGVVTGRIAVILHSLESRNVELHSQMQLSCNSELRLLKNFVAS